jgi:hypothetical protein
MSLSAQPDVRQIADCYLLLQFHSRMHLCNIHQHPPTSNLQHPPKVNRDIRETALQHINQHLFWGLMSVGIGRLNPAFGLSRSASSAYRSSVVASPKASNMSCRNSLTDGATAL